MPLPVLSLRALPRAARVLALGVLLPAAASAQVGHLPATSPYEDFKIGQTITPMIGRLSVGRDPAGVAALSSLLYGLRYDIGVGGPASLYVRYSMAPSERKVLLPSNPRSTRVVGTPSVTNHLIDGGLDVALTGRKTYHRFLPSINGGIGVVSDFAQPDTGDYEFGTKFAFTWGFSMRYVPRHGPQIRVDLTRFIWQYQYPDKYFVLASDTTSVLTNTKDRSKWKGNWGISAGVAIPIFR
jgi:hypothetical protein